MRKLLLTFSIIFFFNLNVYSQNKVINENYIKILTVFSPVMPHIISECLEDLKINKIMWPEIDKNLIGCRLESLP